MRRAMVPAESSREVATILSASCGSPTSLVVVRPEQNRDWLPRERSADCKNAHPCLARLLARTPVDAWPRDGRGRTMLSRRPEIRSRHGSLLYPCRKNARTGLRGSLGLSRASWASWGLSSSFPLLLARRLLGDRTAFAPSPGGAPQ